MQRPHRAANRFKLLHPALRDRATEAQPSYTAECRSSGQRTQSSRPSWHCCSGTPACRRPPQRTRSRRQSSSSATSGRRRMLRGGRPLKRPGGGGKRTRRTTHAYTTCRGGASRRHISAAYLPRYAAIPSRQLTSCQALHISTPSQAESVDAAHTHGVLARRSISADSYPGQRYSRERDGCGVVVIMKAAKRT